MDKQARADKTKERKRERLSNDEQVDSLLTSYGLSLTEEMEPIFGAGHQLPLAIYQKNGEQVKQMVYPTLDYLSQSLGFANKAGYDEIIGINELKQPKMEMYRNRLLVDSLTRAKSQLNRYLQDLRPLLMERHVYFYTTPLTLIGTEAETGRLTRGGGTRVLTALPMSVDAATSFGCSSEKIKELAPQLAWLIPMLVLYRKVKNTKQLMLYLDGWRLILTTQEKEQLHTRVLKHEPSIITKQATQHMLFS